MQKQKMWTFMIKLGSNMWAKKDGDRPYFTEHEFCYHDEVLCDKRVWRKITDFLPSCGINTVLIDVGEGIKLDSHPELANPGSWEKAEVIEELNRLRSMGITPIPKLNFSCAHNAWLKDYCYMVGSELYSKVCKEVLLEVMEIFDYPEFFHLGLEEETYDNQKYSPVATVRKPQKMVKDARALIDTCLEKGVRPWIWLDSSCIRGYGGEEAFLANIPKETLISCWHYGLCYHKTLPENVELYKKLGEWGYEQIPTCSTWEFYINARQTMRWCKEFVKPESIKGYLMAPWIFTIPDNYYGLKDAAYLFGQAKKLIYPDALPLVTHDVLGKESDE